MADDDAVEAALLAAAASVAAPGLTPSALSRRFGPPATWSVRPGQLWRAGLGAEKLLVFIVAVAPGRPTVVPATLEGVDDDQCVVIPHAETGFTVGVTLWTDLQTELPLLALERPVDEFPSALEAIRAAMEPSAKSMSIKAQHSSRVDAIGLEPEFKAALADDLELIIAQAEMGIGDATTSSGTAEATADGNAMWQPSEAWQPTEEQLDELQEATRLPLPQLLPLGDGRRPIPSEHHDAFQRIFGVAPRTLPLPLELLDIVAHPRNRGTILAAARVARISILDAARDVGYKVYGLAARQTGQDTEPAWQQRFDRWAQASGLQEPDHQRDR